MEGYFALEKKKIILTQMSQPYKQNDTKAMKKITWNIWKNRYIDTRDTIEQWKLDDRDSQNIGIGL